VTLEDYVVPSCLISRHEHPEPFVHVVVSGSVRYEVTTGGSTRRFLAVPGTTFVLPQGTTDEVIWKGTTHRIALSLQPQLLAAAMAETTQGSDIELIARWDLVDARIQALVQAMTADLSDGSPVGALYGEHLATALAVYLVGRYAATPRRPACYRGGLPGRRLRRVLDYIGDNIAEDLSLSQLASIAGMSPHYFSELFRQSTGQTPHSFVLFRRIDRAKEQLRDSNHSVIDAAVECGFQNASHFARTFRRFVGVTPREFQRSV
jgi:AraC family transcriptional regulator